MWEICFINERFEIEHTKKWKKKIAFNHIESNYSKEDYQVNTTILYDHIPADTILELEVDKNNNIKNGDHSEIL